jgi:tellurite resistance protein
MKDPIFAERRSLEEAFFRQRDAELIAEMRRLEALQTRKKALTEVSGITDDDVLKQLVAHDIHAETLAAFSLVPLIEVAWADGTVPPAERDVLLHAMEEAGIQKESIAFQLTAQWLERRPGPNLMKLWKNYTRALLAELTPEAGNRIKQTVLKHARAIAEAAGGFLGLGRISQKEEKMIRAVEEAFGIKRA